MEKTKEQIASEWSGLKLDLFTNTAELDYIHPYITPKQCLRAMEAYAEQEVKLCNKPAVIKSVCDCDKDNYCEKCAEQKGVNINEQYEP